MQWKKILEISIQNYNTTIDAISNINEINAKNILFIQNSKKIIELWNDFYNNFNDMVFEIMIQDMSGKVDYNENSVGNLLKTIRNYENKIKALNIKDFFPL